MGKCDDCLFLTWDGEFGTIQACEKDEVTFRDDGVEVGDKIYSWGECPLWKDIAEGDFPEVPFQEVNYGRATEHQE